MSYRNIAALVLRLAKKLRRTPLHPQWFVFRHEHAELREVCRELRGRVLDIGCAEAKPRHHLTAAAEYIGIDYYATAVGWYHTRPDVFADAQALPLHQACVDHVLLLDVLEHLPNPGQCLAEIHRILKPGGSLTMQVPFLYPVHDAPLDFHRWTEFGLRAAAATYDYRFAQQTALGHPLETGALNANIALSKTVLNWLHRKNILGLLAVALPLVVLTINLLSWIGARLSKADPLMPYGYRLVWTKPL